MAIANGLKGLKQLGICKQYNDLANNNVGANGAIAIAEGLKDLEKLGICKQCSDLANNNIG
jgi:hypothetical protein